MIPAFRRQFNSQFTTEKYHYFLRELDDAVGMKIDFRVCETPVFLPNDLRQEMLTAATEIIEQLATPDYFRESERAVPEPYRVANADPHPLFLAIDFGIARDERGRLRPRLIELQGFPSLYGFQIVLSQTFQRLFDLPQLEFLLNGLSLEQYLAIFKRSLLGRHNPENVILMEIQPESQKTAPDFYCTEKFTGVKAICITSLKKRGRKLYYRRNGTEIPIQRIYNRVIVDEFVKKNIAIDFDFRDELDVEWAGHPNWYFRISKFSIPFLRHPNVPRAFFLHNLKSYPDDLHNYVLKPLFSFAGSGVKVEITTADLDAIPESERSNYLLQEKIDYTPVIETPREGSKVEVRMMFFWEDKPLAVTTLARLSKGKMMGVDYNKNKDWVGASCCLFE
ncbi:MAG TPA: hypothetical protein VGA99_05005 [bacterium]